MKVHPFPVVGEDRQDLDRALMGADCVRNHGGELGVVPGLDQDGALAEIEPGCPDRAVNQSRPGAPRAAATRCAVIRILATVTQHDTPSRMNNHVGIPAAPVPRGRMTTSSSSTVSTRASSVVPRVREMGTSATLAVTGRKD